MEISKCFTSQSPQANPCRMERWDDKKAGATADEGQQRGIPGQEMRDNLGIKVDKHHQGSDPYSEVPGNLQVQMDSSKLYSSLQTRFYQAKGCIGCYRSKCSWLIQIMGLNVHCG